LAILEQFDFFIQKMIFLDNRCNFLFRRHKSYAFTIALNVLKNREDAEEAAHDSFLKAFKSLSKFNRQAKFSTWLYRIVFNTAVTYQRRRKTVKVGLDVIQYSYSENEKSQVEVGDQKYYIRQGLDRLSETDRTVITLFYLKELTIEEVGEITGIETNNVKVKLHRARKRLAAEMKKILNEEALNL